MGHVRSSLMSRTSRTTLVPEAFQLRDSAQCSRMLLVRMIFLFVLIILHSSYVAYGTSASFSTISITLICALVSSLNCAILLAVPPSSRHHGFWARCPPTGTRVWPQLLTLIPCSLQNSTLLLVLQAGRFH
jgi:hypothetical protein